MNKTNEMTDIKITFRPTLEALAKKFGNINIQSFMQTQIRALAFTVEGEAKMVTPVDTGRLRASIRVLPSLRTLEATIAPHTEYATYVHEGTRYMRGRPYMYWGAKKAVVGLDDRLSKGLESLIQDKIR